MYKGYWCHKNYETQTVLTCSQCKYVRTINDKVDNIKWYPLYCERCGARLYKNMADLCLANAIEESEVKND